MVSNKDLIKVIGRLDVEHMLLKSTDDIAKKIFPNPGVARYLLGYYGNGGFNEIVELSTKIGASYLNISGDLAIRASEEAIERADELVVLIRSSGLQGRIFPMEVARILSRKDLLAKTIFLFVD